MYSVKNFMSDHAILPLVAPFITKISRCFQIFPNISRCSRMFPENLYQFLFFIFTVFIVFV